MRVGLTLLSRAGQNVWNNGLGQNLFHLASAMEGLPFVEEVILLDCGDQLAAPDLTGDFAKRYPIVPLAEASDLVDVVLEVCGALTGEWAARFRARGGRVVFYVRGTPYAGLVEPTTFDRSGFFGDHLRFDEIWLLEKDRMLEPMMRAIHRCPVQIVPYLWSPVFLDQAAQLFAGEGAEFGYKLGSLSKGQVQPAIFEPNLSPRKSGLIPYLICETAHRADSDLIKKVRFLNTVHFKDHPTFSSVVGNSDLYKDGRFLFEARDYFPRVMGQGANIVVSHQIECAQNYLYLDAIHGNYPLVHNSEIFRDIGYYYPASEVGEGYIQLLFAIAEHDRNLDDYAARSARAIEAVRPQNPHNQDAYARLLLNLAAAPDRV